MTQEQKSLKEFEIALDMATIKIKEKDFELGNSNEIIKLREKELQAAKDEIFRLQEIIHHTQDDRNEVYQLLAECTLRRNASEMRVDYLKSQLSDLVFIKSEDVRTYQRKDELEEWLTELRDNLKNGNTIDNDTLSNEINELLNES